MGDTGLPLLCFDARALSCPLTKEWYAKAKDDIRYRRTWDRLAKQRNKWRYDKTDCQCISAFGEEEHDSKNECRCCGKCIADEPSVSESWATYDDQGFCLSCILALENCSIEELAPLFS